VQERQGIEITGRLGHSTIELALLLSSFNSWERTGRWSTQSRRKCWIANCFPGWIRYSHPRGSGCDREILNLSKMKLCLLRHTRSSQPESSQNISVARGAWPQKFSQHIVILCLETRYPKQNIVIHLNSNIWAPIKFFGSSQTFGQATLWVKTSHI